MTENMVVRGWLFSTIQAMFSKGSSVRLVTTTTTTEEEERYSSN
jgi:hypothetical protein